MFVNITCYCGDLRMRVYYDADADVNLIKNKKIGIRHEVTEDGNYVITAPTEDLQKYIIKYSEVPEAYNKDNSATYSKMN